MATPSYVGFGGSLNAARFGRGNPAPTPENARRFSALLPPAHAMQAFLGLAYNQPTSWDPAQAVIVLLTSGVLAFGLAIYLFNWDTQNSSRRGHPLMALLALVPYVLSAVL